MEEQSHKDAMRDAVRGDFDRLRARQQRRRTERGAAGPPPQQLQTGGKVVLTPPPRPSQAATSSSTGSPGGEETVADVTKSRGDNDVAPTWFGLLLRRT